MSSLDAAKVLMELGRRGEYVFTLGDLAVALSQPRQSRKIENTVRQLTKAGILVKVARGVYVAEPFVDHSVLHKVALAVNKDDFTAESLKTAASQWGIISQLFFGVLTAVTTGPSEIINTPWGRIELQHVDDDRAKLISECVERHGQLPITNVAATRRYLQRYADPVTMMMVLEADEDEFV